MFTSDYWTLANDAWIWIVVAGFIIAFFLAFGIGANDVANSFGSSVGAEVLTLTQACILGTIFEILGAVLIGAKVSNTIRKGIISVDSYSNGSEAEFMVGNLAALGGSCIWMLVASCLTLPVSATHSIVGATLGFSIVARGTGGVSWGQLGKIIGSWFISPLMSGAISTGLFFLIFKVVISKDQPLEPGLKLLPIFYAVTIAINFFSIFYKGSELLHFNKIPLYGTFILAFGPAIICALIVQFIVVPWLRRKIKANAQLEAQKKEEEGLMESDKNCDAIEATTVALGSLGLQEKGLFLAPFSENKENGVIIKPKDTSTPRKKSKKLPLGIHDSNIDQALEVCCQSKGNLSTNSKRPLLNGDLSGDLNVDGGAKGEVGAVAIPQDLTVSSEDSESSSLNDDDRLKLARKNITDTQESKDLFSFLQVLTAIFASFAHGGNDVSNAIGPLVALWVTAHTGSTAQKAPVPIWILLLGGLGISLGLWLMGRRVMKTIGKDLTKITPSSGFCIEIGSALTVLIASNIGLPISTTHCKVGSIVFVGWFRSREGVDWKLFRNIVIAWFVTLPIAGLLSAAFMAGLRELI